MKEKWQVIYDGPSRPIILSPDGRMLSISQFKDGQWQSYDLEDKDCKEIVVALTKQLRKD